MVIQKHIEEVFEKHRLEKVPKNQTVYCDEIKKKYLCLGKRFLFQSALEGILEGQKNQMIKLENHSEIVQDCTTKLQ